MLLGCPQSRVGIQCSGLVIETNPGFEMQTSVVHPEQASGVELSHLIEHLAPGKRGTCILDGASRQLERRAKHR